MDMLIEGLGVALIGMAVVFLGLVILIAVVGLLKTGTTKKETAPAEPVQASPAASPPPASAAQTAVDGVQDTSLVIAIIAAIAMVWQEPQGFIVRRIRRV